MMIKHLWIVALGVVVGCLNPYSNGMMIEPIEYTKKDGEKLS